MDDRVPVHESGLTKSTKKIASDFESLTKKFLTSLLSNQIECPSCKNAIDFNKSVNWYGPDTFSCGSCDKFLSMQLIQRALRDLSIQSFEIPEF